MMAASEMAVDSSSDDELLKLCREAVWETPMDKTKDVEKVQESKRLVVSTHDHDGNQLQVSQGFQSHVAKKLSHFLDNQISELPFADVKPNKTDDGDEDEVFRLFSTSMPTQETEDPPPPVRRRPVPSSSDSDSEMEQRFREAAVSFKDLVPALPEQHTPPTEGPVDTKVVKKKKKKKKKKVPKAEEEIHVSQEQDKKLKDSHSNGVDSKQDNDKVVRRKKKRQKTELL